MEAGTRQAGSRRVVGLLTVLLYGGDTYRMLMCGQAERAPAAMHRQARNNAGCLQALVLHPCELLPCLQRAEQPAACPSC